MADGTMQTVTANTLSGLSGHVAAFWRQMRQTRHTLTLRGWGFAAKYERIEITNELCNEAHHQRHNDVKK
jgi:hypothetical protein